MVSEPSKQSMAWMETDYSKHTHFRWKIKWRLEHLAVALGIMGETDPLTFSPPKANLIWRDFTFMHFALKINLGREIGVEINFSQVFVQGAKVITHNRGTTNGVLHVINRILSPPAGDVQQVLKADLNLAMFSKLLRNSNLNVTNVTVFAPTDEAFKAIPRDRLDRLLNSEKCLEVRMRVCIL